MVNACTYVRISADKLEEGRGVGRQQRDADRLCAERGWSVVERITDNDRSASRYARRGREGWARLLHLLDAGAVEAVVAYDLDRLTRRPDELAPLIAAAERGVRIVTVTGSLLDLSSADGIFAARILLAVAEKEAANASRRQRAKLRHDAEQGRPHWPRRPFGYSLTGEVVEAEAAWMRTLVDWLAGGMSATEAARRLNDAGVAQPSGRPWQSAGVKLLVTSPRNIGQRTYHGEIVGPAAWPAVIDEDQWRAACTALAARAQGARRGRRSMLTGMVRCAVCGETMTRTNATEKAVWRCTKHRDTGRGCGQSIAARPVEELVVEAVLVRIGDVRPRPRAARITAGPSSADLQRELDDLAEMVGRGDLTMTEWKAARAPLVARLRVAQGVEAQQDAGAALARLAGDRGTLRERWDDLDVDLRRRLIALVLDRVEIAASTKRTLDLDRVALVWCPA